MSVPNFMAVYSMVVGTFQSAPKWWIDGVDNQLKGSSAGCTLVDTLL